MISDDITRDGVTGAALKAARRHAYRVARHATLTTDQVALDAILLSWRCFMQQFEALDRPDFVLLHLTHAYEAGLKGDDASDVAFGCQAIGSSRV